MRASILLLLFCLLGCTRNTAVAGRPADSKAAERTFRVAILLPRSIEADGWTRSGYRGLKLIESELGAGVAYTENLPEADFESRFLAYAAEGYDFVIGHGAQFIGAAEKAAKAYPRVSFAVAGIYGGNNANLGGVSMREGEMAYLFGAIAAIKTRTLKVAFLGGSENPNSREITALFRRGVQATKSGVDTRIDWVGDFTDAARARELAKAEIEAGVDIIFVLAGAAGTGVHAQAEKAGIHTLGWIEDLHDLAPKAVITSNIQDIPEMLLRAATLAKQGRWEGKQYRFGMAEGVQRLAPFNGLLSAQEEALVETVRKDILSGKIDAVE